MESMNRPPITVIVAALIIIGSIALLSRWHVVSSSIAVQRLDRRTGKIQFCSLALLAAGRRTGRTTTRPADLTITETTYDRSTLWSKSGHRAAWTQLHEGSNLSTLGP
jgi:hypothetical protein